MPADTMKGYPFYIPGIAGHRPPKPPLDTRFDGGLPRHVVRSGTAVFPQLNTLDFGKDNVTMVAQELPEAGTAAEQQAMRFHARRTQPSYWVNPVTQAVNTATFTTNGLPATAGAPFADPCVTDAGAATGTARVYKAASFQMDVKYNKAGWHFPQHRMFALWADVDSIRLGLRPPEPLFFRANTGDCITFSLVNLIPKDYEMDDFQVKSPTDVVGQHIHLVKFDVTSSDGAANGFNYEDGSFAPGETVERVHAIRRQNGCTGIDSGDPRDNTFTCPVAKAHPFFGAGPNNAWVGAQETLQRWYVDNVLNLAGKDRTLRTVFTHDHFGPSTHQQTGLYAGLVTEPAGSTWRDPETGVRFGTRTIDGGPTSWRADILTANPDSSYREFNLQVADFTLAYTADHQGLGPNPSAAINPPGRFEPSPILPDLLRPPVARNACPNGDPPPCPELVSADEPGTMSINYRNEPVAMRVRDPNTNQQAAGLAGDLSFAFQSRTDRADARFNTQPGFYRPLTGGVGAGDPFTPLLRAKEGDRVQIRVLVGAHEEGHNFNVHAPRWLFEPSDANSGFRNSQMMGISEHYEFVLPPLPKNFQGAQADYLYQGGASTDDSWNGTWGIMRSYVRGNTALLTLPNNQGGNFTVMNASRFTGICPKTAPVRRYDVSAVAAASLPGGTLVYNPRTTNGGPLHDPTAIVYVHSADLDTQKRYASPFPVEPLVLRAAAGECVEVTLRNTLPATLPDLDGYNTLPMIVDRFNANQVRPSSHVGLHPQLLSYDVTRSDGANVGMNPVQTAAPGDSVQYQWYAGELILRGDTITAIPTEFGAANLISSDPIEHAGKGAIGAFIVEPTGSSWQTTRVGSSPTNPAQSAPGMGFTETQMAVNGFHEQVLLFQNNVNLRFGSAWNGFAAGAAVPNLAEAEDPEDSGQKAINYRTEPLWFRMGFAPNAPLSTTRTFDFRNSLSNLQVGGDPATPLFHVGRRNALRLRVLQPGGHSRNGVFQLHGHVWEELPYVNGSRALSSFSRVNPLSEWKGSRDGHGPTNHFDVVPVAGAGGLSGSLGDFLFRDQVSLHFGGGTWGIMRNLFNPDLLSVYIEPRGYTNGGYEFWANPAGGLGPDSFKWYGYDRVNRTWTLLGTSWNLINPVIGGSIDLMVVVQSGSQTSYSLINYRAY
jgi:hypothetical protein